MTVPRVETASAVCQVARTCCAWLLRAAGISTCADAHSCLTPPRRQSLRPAAWPGPTTGIHRTITKDTASLIDRHIGLWAPLKGRGIPAFLVSENGRARHSGRPRGPVEFPGTRSEGGENRAVQLARLFRSVRNNPARGTPATAYIDRKGLCRSRRGRSRCRIGRRWHTRRRRMSRATGSHTGRCPEPCRRAKFQ